MNLFFRQSNSFVTKKRAGKRSNFGFALLFYYREDIMYTGKVYFNGVVEIGIQDHQIFDFD